SEWYDDGTLQKWHALDDILGYNTLETSYRQKECTLLPTETIMNAYGLTLEQAIQVKAALPGYFDKVREAETLANDINLQSLPVSDVYDNYHKKLTEITLRREEWEAEKNESISSLIWYTPELAEKLHLPQDGKLWHLHPLGWIENFSAIKNTRWHDPVEYPQRTYFNS